MEKVIETYEQLVNSGLTWNIVLFGEPIERGIATHQDPSRKKFWKEKEVVEYEDFPYERVINYLDKLSFYVYNLL